MSRLVSDTIGKLIKPVKDIAKAIRESPVISAQALLDLLLTVDGPGSGLDADKLDGEQAIDFVHVAGDVMDAGAEIRWKSPNNVYISDVQTGADNDQRGLAIYVHPSGTFASPAEKALEIDHGKIVRFESDLIYAAGNRLFHNGNNLHWHIDGNFGGTIYWEMSGIDGTYQTIMPYTNTFSFVVEGWFKTGTSFVKVDLAVEGTGGGDWQLGNIGGNVLTLYFDQTNGMRVRRSAGTQTCILSATIKYGSF